MWLRLGEAEARTRSRAGPLQWRVMESSYETGCASGLSRASVPGLNPRSDVSSPPGVGVRSLQTGATAAASRPPALAVVLLALGDTPRSPAHGLCPYEPCRFFAGSEGPTVSDEDSLKQREICHLDIAECVRMLPVQSLRKVRRRGDDDD